MGGNPAVTGRFRLRAARINARGAVVACAQQCVRGQSISDRVVHDFLLRLERTKLRRFSRGP